MHKFDTKVQHLKYKVLREVARHAWNDTLMENVMDIPKAIVPGKVPPMASFTRSPRIARSLYTQQRMVGTFPGTIAFGMSITFSISVSFQAWRATSRSTLYFRC